MNTRMMAGGQIHTPSQAITSPAGNAPGSVIRAYVEYSPAKHGEGEAQADDAEDPPDGVLGAAPGDQSSDDGERQDRRKPQQAEDIERGGDRIDGHGAHDRRRGDDAHRPRQPRCSSRRHGHPLEFDSDASPSRGRKGATFPNERVLPGPPMEPVRARERDRT